MTRKNETVKILFVCHGNICRSAMAEYMMKDMVKQLGIAAHYEISSAATSTEEIGTLSILRQRPSSRSMA